MTKEILIQPAWDRTHSDPNKNYGIHCAEMLFILKGEKGAVNFTLYTNWYLPKNRSGNLGEKDFYPFKYWMKPQPTDLGHHSLTPIYEGQDICQKECYLLDGKPCYYDGSTLNAEPVFEILIAEGLEGLWKKLEEYYKNCFGE